MKGFEILRENGDVAVRAHAGTRAGLVIAALQGMFAVAEPQLTASEEKSERPFSVEADDFPKLLVETLERARAVAAERGEAYDDIRFTLITDKKAEGMFVGRAASGSISTIKTVALRTIPVEKNEEGEWEATIAVGA